MVVIFSSPRGSRAIIDVHGWRDAHTIKPGRRLPQNAPLSAAQAGKTSPELTNEASEEDRTPHRYRQLSHDRLAFFYTK
jgi:hypothetical protein